MVLAEGTPKRLESVPSDRIEETIEEKKDQWGPEAILRARAISFGATDQQLNFFDAHLIPSYLRARA